MKEKKEKAENAAPLCEYLIVFVYLCPSSSFCRRFAQGSLSFCLQVLVDLVAK